MSDVRVEIIATQIQMGEVFFFLPVLRLDATDLITTDLRYLYITRLNQALCSFSPLFLLYLVAITWCGFWGFPLLSSPK